MKPFDPPRLRRLWNALDTVPAPVTKTERRRLVKFDEYFDFLASAADFLKSLGKTSAPAPAEAVQTIHREAARLHLIIIKPVS